MTVHSQRDKAFAFGVLVSLPAIFLSYGVAAPVAHFAWRSKAAWAPLTWLTCHFVHLNAVHLLVNLVALGVLLWIAQRLSIVGGFVIALAISACAVCLGLALQWWPVAWYCGLSGAMHGGFAWLTLTLATRVSNRRRWLVLALWAGGVVKVLLETMTASNEVGLLGFPIVPQAHLFGYLGASLWAGLSVLAFRHSLRQPSQRAES